MTSRNHSLKKLNTFGIDATASYYLELNSEDQLIELIKQGELSRQKVLVLGGGSNILFRKDFDGLVLHPQMDKIYVDEIDSEYVLVKCEAGTEWDELVKFCVSNNYGGLENLSYIPGNTGAAPIQNIGAYGVEVRECIESVRTIDLENGEIKIFSNSDCLFGYRSSIFKNKLKGKILITSVSFKLRKNPVDFNLSYGLVKDKLAKRGRPTLKSIRETIIGIRQEKLPEPDKLGNAGSFFKNPIIDKMHFETIKKDYKDLPSYATDSDKLKVPAGWLIEKCSWKGYRNGDVGVHTNQALVLVNYNSASGKEIYDLSVEIIQSVEKKFGIILEREVNII